MATNRAPKSPEPNQHHIPRKRNNQPHAEDVKDGLLAGLHGPSRGVTATAVSGLRGIPPNETEGGAPEVEVGEHVCEGGRARIGGGGGRRRRGRGVGSGSG